MENSAHNICAPVIVGVYTRLSHLKICLEALSRNYLADQTDVFVASDGAKYEKDQSTIDEIRDYVRACKGFKSITLIPRDFNYGSTKNYSDAIDEILLSYDRIIIMEDDIVTGYGYLKFINDGLDAYGTDSKVLCVSGYMWPRLRLSRSLCVALPVYGGWGSGFHRENYKKIPYGPSIAKEAMRNPCLFLKANMAMPGIASAFWDMAKGKLDAWDINCFIYMIKSNKRCLFPAFSLVRNIGFDGSGAHCGEDVTFSDQSFNSSELVDVSEFKGATLWASWKLTFEMFGGLSSFSKGIFVLLVRSILPEGSVDFLVKVKRAMHNLCLF